MKKWVKYVVIVLMLVALDQGGKLLVDKYFVPGEDLSKVFDTVHIHPVINDENITNMKAKSLETGKSVGYYLLLDTLERIGLVGAMVAAVILILRVSEKRGLKSYPVLGKAIILLSIAVGVCGILDTVVWRGTLDFICVCWKSVDSSGMEIIIHKSADIKDFYLDAMILPTIGFFIVFVFRYLRSR